MNNKLLVSIITIVYNGVSELEKTIQSVLNQDYPNIQYIVVDGGSKDGTLNIINDYDDQIDVWLSEKDEGISDAFNKGISLAKGDLIGLVNCGDWFESNAVSSIIDAYLKSQTSVDEYTVMHGNIRMYSWQHSKQYPPLPLHTFRYQMPVWHPTIFVNKSVYKQFKYDKSYKIAMDYELFSRVYAAGGKFIYVNSLITNMNTEGISNHNAVKGFNEVMWASRKNLNVPTFSSYFYFYYRAALHKLVTLIKKNA